MDVTRDMLNQKMLKALCGCDLKFVRYGEESDQIRRKNNGAVNREGFPSKQCLLF